jgi:death-on-curing protein
MTILTLEQLLELHALAVRETGGSTGLRDLGRLEAAEAAQTQAVFGEELYRTLFEKAAALVRGIVADHPFVDGNKRSAMLAGLTFLRINGIIFVAEIGELEDFAVQVATQHLDIPAIAGWLESHSKQATN